MRTGVLVIVLAACHAAPPGYLVDADGSATSHVDASTIDAGPCGLRTGMRGKTNRTVHAGGLDRTYIVYLPDGVNARRYDRGDGRFHRHGL